MLLKPQRPRHKGSVSSVSCQKRVPLKLEAIMQIERIRIIVDGFSKLGSGFPKIDRTERLCHSPFVVLLVSLSPRIKLVSSQLLEPPMHLPRRPVEPSQGQQSYHSKGHFGPCTTNKQYHNHNYSHHHDKKTKKEQSPHPQHVKTRKKGQRDPLHIRPIPKPKRRKIHVTQVPSGDTPPQQRLPQLPPVRR